MPADPGLRSDAAATGELKLQRLTTATTALDYSANHFQGLARLLAMGLDGEMLSAVKAATHRLRRT